MSLKNDTLPNEFWKHLAKFDLSDYSQPRWSILVNDNGLQVNFTYMLAKLQKYLFRGPKAHLQIISKENIFDLSIHSFFN